MESRGVLGAGNSGDVSGEGTAGIYDGANDGVPAGGKEGAAMREAVSNFKYFEAVISRKDAQRRLIDDLLALFDGYTEPVMSRLIESGKLTLADVKNAEKSLRELARKDKS